MFVDAEGYVTTSVLTSNLDDESSLEKWIIVSGCNIDLRDKLGD